MVSASPTEITDQMVECDGTTMTFVPFTGTVGEAFVTPPSTTAGTAADSALGLAEIDASITSSSLAKGETAEADDMSDVVSGGEMTAMTAEGSSGGTIINYVSTVATATATAAAAVGVVALL